MFRPFSQAAGVKCRGYSLALQRVLVDFGADCSFAQAVEKLREHYRIEVPPSSVRSLTEEHGHLMEADPEVDVQLPRGGVRQLLAELDGSFLPLVKVEESGADRRRSRQVEWREAKLGLVGVVGSTRRRYTATMATAEVAGRYWKQAALQSGAGRATVVHCRGDGAGWIIGQTREQFGEQGRFLVDFYHVSEYLAAAGQALAAEESQGWLTRQQTLLKESRAEEVLEQLAAHREAEESSAGEAPVSRCYRYLAERREYLDYAGAIKAGLPIGSGEIESGHRSVIQQRLKISGAWWKAENAEKMLALRVCRANGDWEGYWRGQRQAHA